MTTMAVRFWRGTFRCDSLSPVAAKYALGHIVAGSSIVFGALTQWRLIIDEGVVPLRRCCPFRVGRDGNKKRRQLPLATRRGVTAAAARRDIA
jgi:hypothetical protein